MKSPKLSKILVAIFMFSLFGTAQAVKKDVSAESGGGPVSGAMMDAKSTEIERTLSGPANDKAEKTINSEIKRLKEKDNGRTIVR